MTTREERLLAELLRANEELADALRIYDDIERIGKDVEAERAAKERSKVEVRGSVTQVCPNILCLSFPSVCELLIPIIASL